MSEGRESWGNHCEFFLSSLGLAVGLGNIWRFPYVVFSNGGGTFMVPYLIMLVLIGLPALFTEMTIGQYGRVGCSKLYGRMAPLFKGMGFGMIIISIMVNVYYVVIMAWAFYYLFAGFQSELPWSFCSKDWNTYECYTRALDVECNKEAGVEDSHTYWKGKCVTRQEYCNGHDFDNYIEGNCTNDNGETNIFDNVVKQFSVGPAEDYFNSKVLGLVKNKEGDRYTWEDYGGIQWQLMLCLLLAWTTICLTMIKGIQSLGKAAYVITLAPYFILTALLIYTVQLEGAMDGINFYLKPDWEQLGQLSLWQNAAAQILFSLSVGFGSQVILASYNNFNNNTIRDSLLVGLFNSLTSIYAGFVVFSIIGFLKNQTKSSIEEVVNEGVTLAFVSYPTAVVEMAGSPVWSFLFFFMLINLALSSICGGFQTFVAFLTDEFPALSKHKFKLVIGMSICFFLAGLPMTTNGGIHLFTLFDKQCANSVLPIVIMELLLVAWFYGMERFIENIREMGMKVPKVLYWFLRILMSVVTPVVLTTITILGWAGHSDLSYTGYVYPTAVQAIGWVMEIGPLVVVAATPLLLIYRFKKEGYKGPVWSRLISPTANWFSTDRGSGTKKGVENEAFEENMEERKGSF